MTPGPASRPVSQLVILLALLCLAGYVFVYATGRAGPPIRSDGFSYYVYLPSWFIYHDTTLASVANDCCGGDYPAFTAIIRWPGTGRWVNAHPIGVAIMQAPFFLAAHALTRWTNLPPDGFSLYYQHAAGLAGLAWTIGGLALLGRFLLRHFTPEVTAATLLALLFGTSLYHYATYDPFYSHPYSFFLVAALVDLTERWCAAATLRRTVLLGSVAGLIVLTRHPNAVLLAIPPLYCLWTGRVQSSTQRWRTRAAMLALMAVTVAAIVAPQLAIYHAATGRLLVSSYGDLGFTFASPHLAGVLFSVQKGVFFWSPLLMLAVAGLPLLRGTLRGFLLPALVILLVDTYIIASWWDWQFGASYGHRAFVDVYPILALGLASLFAWSTQTRRRQAIVSVAVVTMVLLSLFQMLQYWNGVLPMSDTTWTQYRSAFLRW